MIKIIIRDVEKVEFLHYEGCSDIVLANRHHCVSILEPIIYTDDGVNEEVVRKLIIGKRDVFFSHENTLYQLIEYYKLLQKLESIHIYKELDEQNLPRDKDNKINLIKSKIQNILTIAEGYLANIELFNDFEELKNEVREAEREAKTKKDAERIVGLFRAREILPEDEVVESLEKVFNYDTFCSRDGWNRNSLLEKLDINVCPYCNRQYISIYENDEDTIATADLDHYYAKGIYPFLSLSLYNFIPSCQICNSRFKLKKDFHEKAHIYPYDESFGKEGRFILANDTDIKAILGSYDNIQIDLSIDEHSILKEKIEASKDTFKIDMLYRQHKNLVKELVLKKNYFTKSRIKELKQWLDEMGIVIEADDLKQMLYSNYINYKHFNMKPLSKFTYDILEYLEEDF